MTELTYSARAEYARYLQTINRMVHISIASMRTSGPSMTQGRENIDHILKILDEGRDLVYRTRLGGKSWRVKD